MSDSLQPQRNSLCRVPLSIKFSRQEYWSGLAFLSPGDLPDPGIKSVSPAFQVDSLPLGHQRSPILIPLKVRKPRRADLLPLPSSDALPKSRALLLPGQRAFPPGGRGYNRDSRHTGGCGFGEKLTGAMSHLNDGWPTGCQSATRCSFVTMVSAPTLRVFLPYLGQGKIYNLIL